MIDYLGHMQQMPILKINVNLHIVYNYTCGICGYPGMEVDRTTGSSWLAFAL
jgi:hypothetical protein